ncbi:hypothetical protein R3P38DRAFT_3189191 [Favolaschia claudopus]|uniref:Uncharacterized protein n=1 Tax=Favolaschia claudopus TaxID=2862362 RepID=A0AAW0BS56_9AGAR
MRVGAKQRLLDGLCNTRVFEGGKNSEGDGGRNEEGIGVFATINSEELLYPYLLWALYRPASEAVAPVLRALELPFSGYSTADALNRGTESGTTDLVHFLPHCDNLSQPELPAKDTVQTAHEVKRAMVLTNDKLVLLHAYATQSWMVWQTKGIGKR